MFVLCKWIPQHFLVLRAPRASAWGFHKAMNISQDEIEEKINSSIEVYLRQKAAKDDRLALFYGTAEKDGEPDYEILRKHIEIWTQRHPEDMRDFLEYRNEQLKNNYKIGRAHV